MIPQHPTRHGEDARECVLHNMSAPPRTEVHYNRRAVHGHRIIDLVRYVKGKRSPKLRLNDTELFWEDLEQHHRIRQSDIDEMARQWRGFMSGRVYERADMNETGVARLNGIRCCQDIKLTLAILSRISGKVFLPRRNPNYDIQNLCRRQFVVDDPRIP